VIYLFIYLFVFYILATKLDIYGFVLKFYYFKKLSTQNIFGLYDIYI